MTKRRRRRGKQQNSLTPWIALAALAIVLIGGMIWARTALAPPPRPPDGIARISVQEARRLVDRGQAVLVDTRSVESYQQRHIEGAISLPVEQVQAQVDALPDDGAIIFY